LSELNKLEAERAKIEKLLFEHLIYIEKQQQQIIKLLSAPPPRESFETELERLLETFSEKLSKELQQAFEKALSGLGSA